MAKRYSGNEFALVASVTPCSSSAGTVTADSATAATPAVSMRASVNDGAPIAATNEAPKAGSIIVTGSAITGAATGKSGRA